MPKIFVLLNNWDWIHFEMLPFQTKYACKPENACGTEWVGSDTPENTRGKTTASPTQFVAGGEYIHGSPESDPDSAFASI